MTSRHAALWKQGKEDARRLGRGLCSTRPSAGYGPGRRSAGARFVVCLCLVVLAGATRTPAPTAAATSSDSFYAKFVPTHDGRRSTAGGSGGSSSSALPSRIPAAPAAAAARAAPQPVAAAAAAAASSTSFYARFVPRPPRMSIAGGGGGRSNTPDATSRLSTLPLQTSHTPAAPPPPAARAAHWIVSGSRHPRASTGAKPARKAALEAVKTALSRPCDHRWFDNRRVDLCPNNGNCFPGVICPRLAMGGVKNLVPPAHDAVKAHHAVPAHRRVQRLLDLVR
jgi:hypothetical protein